MDIIVAIGSPGTEASHSQHLRATKYRFVTVNTAIDHVSLSTVFLRQRNGSRRRCGGFEVAIERAIEAGYRTYIPYACLAGIEAAKWNDAAARSA
jgi:hypothetical protein